MTPDEKFGREVKEQRERRGWSMTTFASLLSEAGLNNFHAATIGRMERGQRPVRLTEAVVIAQVLGSRLDDLVVDPLRGDEDLRLTVECLTTTSRDAAYFLVSAEEWRAGVVEQLDLVIQRLSTGKIREDVTDEVRDVVEQAAATLKEDLVGDWMERFRALSVEERRKYRP